MTFDELVTRVLNLEEQNINLATRQSHRSADADSGISETKAKTEEVKRESETSIEEAEHELADSVLMFVEMINDINEVLEEVSENE